MGRMQACKSKGISKSAKPYKRSPPQWAMKDHKNEDGTTTDIQTYVVNEIVRLAKKGLKPSQIGVLLRDEKGIPQVKSITGSKILRILKLKGMSPDVPEDLYCLIKKAVNVRKHLQSNRSDKSAKFRLILIESKIHRLARYYRRARALPPSWRYESASAAAIVS
eukprot:g601.t1